MIVVRTNTAGLAPVHIDVDIRTHAVTKRGTVAGHAFAPAIASFFVDSSAAIGTGMRL